MTKNHRSKYPRIILICTITATLCFAVAANGAINPKKMLILASKNLHSFIDDKTYPDANDPNAQCSAMKQKPLNQSWGPCWK